MSADTHTLLLPPVPARNARRPSLSPTMSATYASRPSPYPTGLGAGAGAGAGAGGRPGMSRTYSFCATSSDQSYTSASSYSKPAVPIARQRQRQRERSIKQFTAPMMERSISTLGDDGLQMSRPEGALKRRDSNENPVVVPSIVVDEPTPRKPSVKGAAAAAAATVPLVSPGSPGWSSTSTHSTPGPVTPGTPFGLLKYDNGNSLKSEGEMQVDTEKPKDDDV